MIPAHNDVEPGPGDSVGLGSAFLRDRLGLAIALLAAALATLALFLWEPLPSGIWHDDGVYLLIGKSLAQGEGLHYLGVSGTPPASKFPPIFPLTLALVWRLFPNLPLETGVFGLVNVFWLVCGGAVFAAYLARALRFSVAAAVGVTALAWLSVDLWRVAMVPLSEPLFILLLIATLWAGTELERRPGGRQMAVFLAGFALLFHTRTIGVVVGAAVPLALLMRGHRRIAAATAVGAVGITLPWVIWSRSVFLEIPEPLRDILGSYGGWLVKYAMSSPASFLAGLPAAAWALLDRLLLVTIPLSTSPMRVVAAFVLVSSLAFGLHRLSHHSRTTAFTILLLLGVLWVWPYQDRRLVTPLIPLLWVVGVLSAAPGVRALRGLVRHDVDSPVGLDGARRLLPLAGVLAVVWIGWFGLGSMIELNRGAHVASYRIRATMLARSVEALRRMSSNGAVIGSPELWPGIHLHTGMTVAPSAPFSPINTAGPSWGDPGQQFRLWQDAGIEYVILEQGGRVHGAALDELTRLCADQAVRYVAIWRGASLAYLNWDEDCKQRARAWEPSS